jgi:hypothetical protein
MAHWHEQVVPSATTAALAPQSDVQSFAAPEALQRASRACARG